MSAVERLEAAIEKLEALKAESTPGPWKSEGRGFIDGGPYSANEVTPTQVNCMSYCYGGTPQPMERIDADLIVTLHRTIDAQLAILRFGVQRLHAVAVLTGKHAEAHAHELALADAILGSES